MEETNEGNPANLVEGVVTSFDSGKGYGFIALKGSTKEVFVHHEAILGPGPHTLVPGDRVSFEVTESARGPRASAVTKL